VSEAPDLAGIFAAHTDQHAIALAVGYGGGYLQGFENPQREAKLLLVKAVGKELHNMNMGDFDEATMERYIALCKRRRDHEPMSHLLETREFWKSKFVVRKAVLDPRPETEALVEAALNVPFQRVLDLGTGSGCILVSLLVERPDAMGIGVDKSAEAIEVAVQNVMALDVWARCQLGLSDWYADVEGQFDLIVSNPPYIALDEMAGLSPEGLHEPRMALTDEGDGLSCYRIIAAGAPQHLTAGGWLMVEIGPTQGAAVTAMFEAAGLTNVGICPDLDGRARVVVGQKPL